MLTQILVIAYLTPASASGPERLFGKWGDEAHCAQTLISDSGTKRFTPFDLKRDWLGYGGIWCRLIWLTERSTPTGVYATASARCGEDSVRDYRIIFSLDNEHLSIMWNPEHTNGPLRRCPP